jgi:hypothetical protein
VSWWSKLQRVLMEAEVIVGLLVFGLITMCADLFADLGQHLTLAAIVRFIGVAIFIAYVAIILQQRARILHVPLLFTEETNRQNARNMFEQFVEAAGIRGSIRIIESLSSVHQTDLVITLNRNPRNSPNPDDWKAAWEELLREWEREVDRGLGREPRCYHILPHVALPLSFALGASVGLRRRVILYYRQPGQREIFRVLDLSEDPRQLFQLPSEAKVRPPEQYPLDLQDLPQRDRLLLYLLITDRHVKDFQAQFQLHPDYIYADNVAFAYWGTLNPQQSWLPYVQHLVCAAQPLVNHYRQVELCLICPSAIAFALGMAFSRNPFITICDWQNGRYVPVFSLKEIEKRLAFD